MTRRRPASELGIALGLSFNDPEMLQQSLYHRSYLNEAPDREIESNERLEFLGDAVLGLIVSEKLYRDYPALSEGHLSQLRALLVRWDALAQAAEWFPLLGLLGTVAGILQTFSSIKGQVAPELIITKYAPAITATGSGLFMALLNILPTWLVAFGRDVILSLSGDEPAKGG